MELDINYQNFLGHSEEIRKVFFTDDNMHVISIGDSILIWNVLAWNTAQPTMPNNGQCIVPPQSVMTKILENPSIRSNSNSSEVLHYSQSMNENTARTITQTLSKSEIEKIETISQEEKKIINKKLLKKQNDNDYSPSSRRLLIQRINHSQLAKVISHFLYRNLFANKHSYERTCRLLEHRCVSDGRTDVLIGIGGEEIDSGDDFDTEWSVYRDQESGHTTIFENQIS